jgi:excisionase family DNA binding protein
MPDTPERLTYSVKEVSQILGLPYTTALEATRRGDLPSVRLGKRVLVLKSAVDALLASAGTGRALRAVREAAPR